MFPGGVEGDSLIANERRAGPDPVELSRLRGVFLVPVLRDVGARFVESKVEASEYFLRQSPEHLGAFQPLADAAHGIQIRRKPERDSGRLRLGEAAQSLGRPLGQR